MIREGTAPAAATSLPMLHLEGAALPPATRLEAFRQVVPGYSVEPLTPPDREFEVDARAWQLGDLLVTATRLTAVRVERTRAHIRADGRDTCSFILLRDGSWTSDIASGFIQVSRGQICVMDFAQEWINVGAAQDNVMLVVPRVLIDEIAPNAPSLHGRMMVGASGRLLAEHMLALARHLPDMTTDDVQPVEHATISLLSAALGALPQDDDRPFRRQDRRSESKVLAYIERGLTDPELSVAAICRDVGVGRATLYRAFRSTGGIAAYIRQRRLEAAHARIADEAEKASMAEVADLYCFSSPAHFSTAFRRHFGYTPVNARAANASAREVHEMFEGWRRVIARTAAAEPERSLSPARHDPGAAGDFVTPMKGVPQD